MSAWLRYVKELLTDGSEAEGAPLLADLDAVNDAMTEMTAEAGTIFTFFKQNQPDIAGQHMATMDRKYAKLNTAFNYLGEHVGVIQKRLFDEQLAVAASLGKFEYVIAGLILLMVSAAALYGHKIAKQMESDAREKERYTESLQNAEALTRNILETAADGIITFDEHGIIESLNNSVENIFGFSTNELIGQNIEMLIPKLRRDEHQDHFSNHLLTSDSVSLETPGQRKDETTFPLDLAVSERRLGNQRMFTAIMRDITERKSFEGQLTHQALHDPLTGLANRVLFRNRVEHALALADRNHRPLAVLLLDLDGFKTINDTLGHEAGDQLLVSVGERLTACLRVGDTAARLGGDEFAVLVEDAAQTDNAVLVAERLSDVLRASFTIDGKEIFIGASIGIAVTAAGKENPEELLRNADLAMYSAKNQGKDRYVVFENAMHLDLLERAELEEDMRRAIEREEFMLYYQPIVDLNSGQMTGMEALVRWQHPTRGIMPPLNFIPIAEETGLIIPLGRWILETACRQARRWHKESYDRQEFTLTVNLSSGQFQQPRIVETVAEALDNSGLPPHCLVLEITETMMLNNTEATINKLEELKDLGVRLAIDDFGTGYSSLSYLQRFPVDILKIDRAFVDKISHGREGAAVAQAIITMSNALQLRAIAEGIEKPEQLLALEQMGCELGQGYYFSKPLDEKAMGELLKRGNFGGGSLTRGARGRPGDDHGRSQARSIGGPRQGPGSDIFTMLMFLRRCFSVPG